MKNGAISMQEWMEIFQQATREVVSGALKFDGAAAEARKPAAKGTPATADDEPRPGAYIAILGDGASMHLGITASRPGCRTLACSLLGLRESQEIGEQEIGDAVSELMNIIAGKVKSRASERDPSLRLGLPMFIQGKIQHTGSMEYQHAEVPVGPVTCELVVYRSKRRDG